MIGLSKRHPGPELMDQPDLPVQALEKNLEELETINTWLGGYNCTFHGLRSFHLDQTRSYHILDIGCGGGDTIRACDRWARKLGLEVQFTGLDSSSTAIRFAQRSCEAMDNVQFVESRFQDHQPEHTYDIIMCSLFAHHLYGTDLSALLQFMHSHSTLGFTINDLERHPLALGGIRILTQLLSRSYLVKHDAPMSVQRGFLRDEWRALLDQEGLSSAAIDWVWAFRHAITFKHHV